MELIGRKEAIARGLKRYFTGKPCKHGHVAERQVSSCGCVECESYANYTSERKAQAKKTARAWYLINYKPDPEKSKQAYERRMAKLRNQTTEAELATGLKGAKALRAHLARDKADAHVDADSSRAGSIEP